MKVDVKQRIKKTQEWIRGGVWNAGIQNLGIVLA
jgi:hypothetical protein